MLHGAEFYMEEFGDKEMRVEFVMQTGKVRKMAKQNKVRGLDTLE